MSRDNQIEEIARDLCSEIGVAIVIVSLREDGTVNLARSEKYLKNLVDKGYRKSTDVAEEIFAEIEDVLNNIGYFDELDFEALKKKYESEKEE